MLLPDNNGMFVCKRDDFVTPDLFEFLDHFGIEYGWMVRLSPRFSLNLFEFLNELNNALLARDFEDAYEHLQSATLLMINASGEDFDEFVEEAQVVSNSKDMLDQIERFLENDHGTE